MATRKSAEEAAPTPDKRAREWLARIALTLVASVVALALAELLLRLAYPIHGVVVQSDERYLFRLIPGSSKIYVDAADPTRRAGVKVNRRGFRGPELSPRRRGRQRVVVYGDSFILAEFSPWEETYPYQLQRRLTAIPGRDLEVVNAGVLGYGPDQICLRIADEIAALDPDLVVLALYAGNDFGDLIRNKIFKLSAAGELVERDYQLHPRLAAQIDNARYAPLLGRLLRGATRRIRGGSPPGREPGSVMDQLAYWQGYQTAELNDYFKNDQVVRLFEDWYDVAMSTAPEAAPSRMKAILMARLIERIRTTVERRGAALLLLLIPAGLDVCPTYADAVDRALYPSYRPSNLTDLLESTAHAIGVAEVNLFEPFRRAGGCPLYLGGGNDHWNGAGQALAAELTAERIRSEGWLDDPAHPSEGWLSDPAHPSR
ncbi:MAG: hypothetical protein GY856_12995 [bacterium]|nr:hypothetical protein [bacterium]